MVRHGEMDPQRELHALVVGDDRQLGEFLRLGFEYEGVQVSSARTAPSARAVALRQQPEVIVLICTPSAGSWVALIRRLRADACDAAILTVGAADSVDERIAALEAGADDAMSRPISFRELMARVRAVLRRRDCLVALSTLGFADLTLDPESRVVTRGGRAVQLTPREFALLELFLRHPRQVLTREVLLARVWGINYIGDDNVVEVYIHTLRQKLGDLPPRLIQTVRGIGYVLRGPSERQRARDPQRRQDRPGADAPRPHVQALAVRRRVG